LRRLTYPAAASGNLNDILEFVTLQSGSAEVGYSFVERLRIQCLKLASLPGALGRPRYELRHDLRNFPFNGYAIFFRYFDDRLEIVNILHAHRDIEAAMGEREP
jgi:toxin ParE1/3/4